MPQFDDIPRFEGIKLHIIDEWGNPNSVLADYNTLQALKNWVSELENEQWRVPVDQTIAAMESHFPDIRQRHEEFVRQSLEDTGRFRRERGI
ncbi:hypothetical protein A2773_04150 [Candidatus Gottesmanbacteria bacterium RIFCSPHIGHO2_01_FULL_39_10]|uniref:Uncharacterized protein n=1 Tax=Candidatus Gottesmanbacteria bacterium RIFCSPHIGHO2_01_FULL_39_10 TaxID=1798375 RepID=A0A1F5ZRC7_9BACT|nr:MAG: hypothetical protein A2773_04150 [Candidatus Gottesmanbacteria bacterium RIFCSPHIGHO2_01_FULL_39_10]